MIGISIVVFIIVLGLLVIVHEIGHFISARIFKVGVDEFGIGFPPRAIGFRRKETMYSINWIPVGGFVKIKGVVGGDQMDSPVKESTSVVSTTAASFSDKPIWQRFVILFAGIGMNFLLASVMFSIGYTIGMPSALGDIPTAATVHDQKVVIVDFVPSSMADEAGLQIGDVITSINGQPVQNTEQLQFLFTNQASVDSVDISIERSSGSQMINRVPIVDLGDGRYGLGAYFTETGIVQLPWYHAIWYGAFQTFELTKMIILALASVIAGIFTSGQVDSSLAGPLGIASLTHQATQLGFIYVLQFAALLSINLAIFNLLPFPALDGGRIAFLVFEVIARRPVNPRVEAIIHNLGFILLLLLIIAVTIKDVFSFF